jgi:hypothetical protein
MEMSKKKPFYPVGKGLRVYLNKYDREKEIEITYDDLMRSEEGFPLYDSKGNDTLWLSMMYPEELYRELTTGLTQIYSYLRTDGDDSEMQHLRVDRIDYCTFGNSKPFRIRIVNGFNDNYDYFYVKRTDASRIYGLELEDILSPNRINFLVDDDTLIEEHIPGIPGDQFIREQLDRPTLNKVRIAKEFVKFNERCFVRLLGDMRSYNYVVDITPDFDDEQYRVRAIDFDQQTFEGRKSLYIPQFYKENNAIVELCGVLLNLQTAKQYQKEERTLIAKRLVSGRHQLKDLIDCMRHDTISLPEKIKSLREELNEFHNDEAFLECKNMGEILHLHMKNLLHKVVGNRYYW